MTSPVRLLWSRLRALVSRDRLDRDFDDELATHLELLTDDARRRGLSEEDARREALLTLGQPASLREQHRDARGLPLVDAVVQDSRYALRTLRKSPIFTAVVTLTLALGIGANTALFSLVDNLLLRSLPVRDPERLVQLQVFGFGGSPKGGRNDKPLASEFNRAIFDSVRARNELFADVAGFRRPDDRVTVSVDGAAEPLREVEFVSENFFTSLGVLPVVGRSPMASDDNVAVISARWWRARFGGRDDVIGRALAIDGKNYQIIGVAPRRFHGFDVDRSADIWILRTSENLWMIARLQPGVTPAQAEAAALPLLRRAVGPEYQSEPMAAEALPVGHGLSRLRDQYKTALLALMGLVTLVLLTTCANVGNLIMVRNAARRRELTVRAALGAGRSRLIVQSLVESAALAAAGCIAGLFLARWGVSIIVSMLSLPALPDALTFHADARVIGFAATVSVLSVLLYGLGPAWRATDVDLVAALRASQGGVTQPKRTRRLGRALVGCQVALSVLLLVCAGLFIQTLRNLSRLDIGFGTERLLQVSLETGVAGYKPEQVPNLHRLLLERVAAVPGVRSATSTGTQLMQGSSSTTIGLPLPGLPATLQMWDGIDVGPHFFETMGIAVVRGRTFVTEDFARNPDDLRPSPAERGTPAGVAAFVRRLGPFVINEAFAKHYPPNADPLAPGSPIVGIVKDVKLFDVRDDVHPLMFMAYRRQDRLSALVVRTAGDPQAIQAAIRETIQAVHPRLFFGTSTLGEVSGRNIARERMIAAISGFFGALGLSLACMGIFGVASGTVAQRTKELGIRRALGAGHWSVIRESLRGTLVVVTLGLAVGSVAAVIVVRAGASLIAGLLFGLTATDKANLIASIVVMVVVAIAACTLPALRATRIDPLAVIREE